MYGRSVTQNGPEHATTSHENSFFFWRDTHVHSLVALDHSTLPFIPLVRRGDSLCSITAAAPTYKCGTVFETTVQLPGPLLHFSSTFRRSAMAGFSERRVPKFVEALFGGTV